MKILLNLMGPWTMFRGLTVFALAWLLAGSVVLAEPLTEDTILSFNIRYGTANDGANSWLHRRDLVQQTIASYGPAIFGVQECLGEQAAQLRRAFPGYQFTGAGRNDGKQSGEMCAVFVDRTRYEVLDQGVFWLSETPDVPGSKGWDAALPRIATWVELQDLRDEARTLFVFNVHFDHVGSLAREKSAALLRLRLATIASGRPVILMGDFNDPAGGGTPSYRALTVGNQDDGLILHDTWSQASREQRMRGEGTFHGFSGEATRGRIDWILTSPHLAVIDAGIDRGQRNGKYPSDHFAVWAKLQIETAPAALNDKAP